MAQNKDIIITPLDGTIHFDADTSVSNPLEIYEIRLEVIDDGSIAFISSQGSLFSITDDLSDSLMSVNDISGLPIFEVFHDDKVVAGTFGNDTFVVDGDKVEINGNLSILSNSSKLYFGENQESDIYFDGTDLNISLNDPSQIGVIKLTDDVNIRGELTVQTILLTTIKSGINQGAAGAAAGEFWQDTADNTVKIGV